MNLTEEQILKLEGRELDEAVARQVMGWTKIQREVPQKQTTVDWWQGEHSTRPVECWSPSDNIAQAYEAEEMVPEGEREEYVLDLMGLQQKTLSPPLILLDRQWLIAHATPTQRCRALLLWKLRASQ